MKSCPTCCGSGQGARSVEFVAGRGHVDFARCLTCGGTGEVPDTDAVTDALLHACKAALPLLAKRIWFPRSDEEYDHANLEIALVEATLRAAIAEAEGTAAA